MNNPENQLPLQPELSNYLLKFAELLDVLSQSKEEMTPVDFVYVNYIRAFAEEILEDQEHYISAHNITETI